MAGLVFGGVLLLGSLTNPILAPVKVLTLGWLLTASVTYEDEIVVPNANLQPPAPVQVGN